MARESFKSTPADRVKLQVIGTDDLPDRVSVDLDDKDPNNFTVVEVDDRTPDEKTGTTKDPAEWVDKNAEDPKGVTPRVQKRFDRLKAETETERRIRLETERQRDEALNAGRLLKAEVDDLRQRLTTNTTSLATSMTDERKGRLAEATHRLEQAHAMGDSAGIAKATADISTAAAELTTIQANTPRQQPARVEPEVRQAAPQQTQAPNLSPDTVAWIAANPWFNKDVPRTRFAVSLHDTLDARGVKPGMPEYTKELDKGMKAMYPDHQPYSGSPDEDTDEERSTPPRRTNAVAPGSRETGQGREQNPRTVELTSSQLAIAKQLNLTPQQYAVSLVTYNASRKGA